MRAKKTLLPLNVSTIDAKGNTEALMAMKGQAVFGPFCPSCIWHEEADRRNDQ